MLKNYFIVAFRSLLRHKGYSFLNITGLAVGMAAFFLIVQYVRFETSYDNFNKKGDRIYRVVTDLVSSTGTLHWASTSAPIAINLKADYPEVESVVRFNDNSMPIRKGSTVFQNDRLCFADSTAFSILDFPLVAGDPTTALKAPRSIVLSQSTAKKYFGNTNPIGQSLTLADSVPIKVTGIMKDIPDNSTMKADMFVSFSTRRIWNDSIDYRWGNYSLISYVLLKPNASRDALQAKLKPFIENHIGKYLRESQQNYILFLEPLKDIYWSPRGAAESGSKSNVFIFAIIGLFILLIACINFVNLTTARSTERAKEVGIRKVIGAARLQLTSQFLGESILISIIAFFLSLGLYSILLPVFNNLAGKVVAYNLIRQPLSILLLLVIALVIGFIAGFYPAIVLSAFKPIASLKGRFSTSTKGLLLRRGLVVFQFTISIALIIGTGIVYSQLHYMESRDLGFNKEQTLIVDTHNDKHKTIFRQDIAGIPNIKSTAFSGAIPGMGTYGAYSKVENSRGEMQVCDLDLTYVDFGFLEQYQFKLQAGRFFSKEIGTDTMQAMILNEKAVTMLGYSSAKQAIGRRFDQWGKKGQIIGVIKDYNFNGLQKEITPLSICLDYNDCNFVSIKVGTQNVQGTIDAIKAKWNALVPDRAMEFYFLDESFNKQYESEERFGHLFINFAILAIFISCLGLLGLASYSTLQRTKEVGVRRVLGASVGGIVQLLSVEFLKLVIIAFVIAIPIAWLSMNQWLHDFAYRTTMGWWIFLCAGLLAMFIAFATISWQAIRAALTSPVKSLRSE